MGILQDKTYMQGKHQINLELKEKGTHRDMKRNYAAECSLSVFIVFKFTLRLRSNISLEPGMDKSRPPIRRGH